MTEIITVTGRGRASLPPDRAVLDIILSDMRPDYEEAVELAAIQQELLQAELMPAGVTSEELKTSVFNVREEYENVEQRELVDGVAEKRYKQVLLGFRYTQRLVLELERDNERISRVIGLLSRSKTQCEFSLRFKVEDERKIRELAAVDAVLNAKAVASQLATAAGLLLGEIRSINYAFSSVNVYSRTDMAMPRLMMAESASFKMDINPEDIEQDEEVTIEYALIKA